MHAGHLRRRRQPDGAPQAGLRAELDRARVGLGVAVEPAHPLQPRVGATRTARRGRSASATSGGTPSEGKWTGLGDDPDFVPDKAPGLRARTRTPTGDGRAARRRAVHRAPRRARLALRAERARRRAAADALRAARVAGRQPALRRRRQPDAPALRPTTTNPYNPPRSDVVPVRAHHLPADRAPHGRRDVAHRALPVRAAARAVRRGQPRARRASAGSSTPAGRRSSPRARRSRRACWSPTGCGR